MSRFYLPFARGYSPGGTRTVGPFDYNGIIILGQSLAVGETASPPISTVQPYSSLMPQDSGYLSGGPPTTDLLGTFSLVPLVEFLRSPASNATYPYEFPRNIEGETPASGMANQLAASLGWVCVVGDYGVTAEGIDGIKKGGTTNAYAAMVAETTRIGAAAASAGKTYGVVAVLLVHGQYDAQVGTADYTAQIAQLHTDLRGDLMPITGQLGDIRMIIVQQIQDPTSTGRAGPTLTPLELRAASPSRVSVVVNHQYPYANDHLHMSAPLYRRMGQAAAIALLRDRLGRQSFLEYTGASLAGTTLTVNFAVPVLPLQWSTTVPDCHALTAEWANGRGFEVEDNAGKITINSATIVGSTVELALSRAPGAGARLSHAMYQDSTGYNSGLAAGRHGQLCDSHAFTTWSAKTVSCNVTNGSADVTCVTTGSFTDRGERELVVGTGVHVVSKSGDTITLSQVWSGSTGTASLTFDNDHRHYAAAFSVLLV